MVYTKKKDVECNTRLMQEYESRLKDEKSLMSEVLTSCS